MALALHSKDGTKGSTTKGKTFVDARSADGVEVIAGVLTYNKGSVRLGYRDGDASVT